jgi:hypothetical protein
MFKGNLYASAGANNWSKVQDSHFETIFEKMTVISINSLNFINEIINYNIVMIPYFIALATA